MSEELPQRYSQLTNLQRKKICLYKESQPGLSYEDIAKWAYTTFTLPRIPARSSIFNILQAAEKWKSVADDRPDSIRSKPVRFPELDKKVAEYVLLCESNGQCIQLQHIKRQGKRIAEKLQIPEEDRPTFSDGWANGVCSRYRFRSFRSYGESGDANMAAVPIALADIKEQISGYAAKDISISMKPVYSIE
jgi:hypothetical protein